MTRSVPLIIEVAVPSPLYRRFDYRTAPDLPVPQPGCRVLVPFGRQQLVGIVLALKTVTDIAAPRLKKLIRVLDETPVFDRAMLELLNWTAAYYHHPIGDTLHTALPLQLRRASSSSAPGNWVLWRLTAAGRQHPPESLLRAPRQARLMALLGASPEGASRDALPLPMAVINSLADKGWIEPFAASSPVTPVPATLAGDALPLTSAQRRAVDSVRAAPTGFTAWLLEGVTGSGKTEVYLQLIADQLRDSKQVLVLVPEIGLTPQLVARFQQRFTLPISVLHSGLNDAERWRAWQQAASGTARLIIGTRSAIFTPLKHPGLIVIDEEHDGSFKQQDGLRYSARDLAVWRAHQLAIPVLLGSATPSLESLYNVQQGRYRHLLLPERAGEACHPRMHLLDLRQQPMQDLLSKTLIDAIRHHLDRGGQTLLFLNRRGFAPVLLCHACGWVAACQRCDARLTLHQQQRELRCHHCGSQRRVDAFCPSCGSSELIAIGEGTQRIEQTLQTLFAQHTVLRIDRDSTRRKGALESALDEASSGRAKILLGTQMLAKGHHFPEVTLVAILDADQGLFSSDFRASERMAQLIIQVAGRAGRADRPGEVIIQTHHPDHPLLLQLVQQGYPAFARSALVERQQTGFPPFTSMALLRAEASRAELPRDFLEQARRLAETRPEPRVQLWGPVAAPMERRAGRYRAQLLIQSPQRNALQRFLDGWIPALESIRQVRQVRWSIDVDPIDTY